MPEEEKEVERCPNCGEAVEIWWNSCGELQCDNCGYEEDGADVN